MKINFGFGIDEAEGLGLAALRRYLVQVATPPGKHDPVVAAPGPIEDGVW